MMCSMVSLLLLFLLTSISALQPEPSETFTHSAQLEPNRKIHLYWKFNQTHITFEVHGNTNGWVGIGISPSGSMMGADINVGWVKNGAATITDRHGVTTGNTYPPLDTEQNVELLGGSECDGWTVLKFRSQLAACDLQDLEITTNTVRMIYAWGLEDPTGDDLSGSDYHTPERRGVRSMLLFEKANFEQSRYPEGERHFHLDMRNDKFNLPPKDTFYSCRLFELPHLTTKHHMVKIEPVIDNKPNIHHIVIGICNDKKLNDSIVGPTADCYGDDIPFDFFSCTFNIYAWAVGGSALYYPKNAGYPLGTADSPRYLKMEIHYDNPQRKADIVDSSGFRLTYTPDLRQYDASMMQVGVYVSGFQQIIPPNAKSFHSYGDCASGCLRGSMDRDGFNSINVFGVLLHSHLLGRQLTLKHIRNGTELEPIASDLTYDFNYQETRVLAEERTVMKGDTLRMVCDYDSVGRARVTVGGLPTYQEMCLGYVYFYPRLATEFCMSTPLFSALMSYFGFESHSKPSYKYDESLRDIMVWKPEKYANKTALENLNAMNWNNTEVKKFESDMKTFISVTICYGSRYNLTRAVQKPVKITNPYVGKKMNCTLPSSGFQVTSISSKCPTKIGPSIAPATTTCGTSGLHNVNWLILTFITCIVQYLIQH